MNIKQLFVDEDAVSPVIGVILMVAITVILAAVIGTFVLGLGENVQDSAPQANFQFEYGGDFSQASASGDGDAEGYVEITHTGGEDVERSELSIQFGDNTLTDLDAAGDVGVVSPWSDPVATGSTLNISEDPDSAASAVSNDVPQGATVRVIWTSPSGGTSNTIGESEVPS